MGLTAQKSTNVEQTIDLGLALKIKTGGAGDMNLTYISVAPQRQH